jgi:chromosomal replication initiation ATPase DnaA
MKILPNPILMVGALAIGNEEYHRGKAIAHCMRGVNRLGVKWTDLQSRSRLAEIVEARRLCCMYLHKNNWTLMAIAKEIGYTNHTSVRYQKMKAYEYMEVDVTFQKKYKIFHNS